MINGMRQPQTAYAEPEGPEEKIWRVRIVRIVMTARASG